MSEQETEQMDEISPLEVEKLQEAKLKAKHPTGTTFPKIAGHSAFLQKRLAKGKFFDSGDYQMAKQKMSSINKQPLKTAVLGNPYVTGEVIPTPETVSVRKASIVQSSKFTPNI